MALYVEVLMDTLYAHGAYGREPVKADWTNGLDFKIGGGPYFSITDVDRLKADGYYRIRFYRLSNHFVFEVML